LDRSKSSVNEIKTATVSSGVIEYERAPAVLNLAVQELTVREVRVIKDDSIVRYGPITYQLHEDLSCR
jgi:hypothetical protein